MRSDTALRPLEAASRMSCAVFPCMLDVLRRVDTCDETAVRPSDADSNQSCAVSRVVSTHALVCFLSSDRFSEPCLATDN